MECHTLSDLRATPIATRAVAAQGQRQKTLRQSSNTACCELDLKSNVGSSLSAARRCYTPCTHRASGGGQTQVGPGVQVREERRQVDDARPADAAILVHCLHKVVSKSADAALLDITACTRHADRRHVSGCVSASGLHACWYVVKADAMTTASSASSACINGWAQQPAVANPNQRFGYHHAAR